MMVDKYKQKRINERQKQKQKQVQKFKLIPKHIKIFELNDYKEINNICGVYTFLDKNKNVIYIGSSARIGERIHDHIRHLKNSNNCAEKLLQAWNNNDIIYCGLLKKCKNPIKAEQKEQYYITKWPEKLLNIVSYNKIILSKKDIDRFWPNVDIKGEDECWKWKCYLNKGYGFITYRYIKYAAHRVSYKIAHPDIDLIGITIRHKCNNRSCVNPNHLEIGSTQDNMRDCSDVKKYKAFGEEKYLSDWINDKRCHKTLNCSNLLVRIKMGWSIERAITEPLDIGTQITAFGETKNLRQWEKDDRCKVTRPGLMYRLKNGMSPEDAITKPPHKC